ncbi:polymer-forming cytoskeletal protein [Paenibacillus tarimensis]
MFKGKSEKIDPSSTDTLIGEGTVFKGNLISEASIRIEGQVIGDIECKGDITVGDKGSVESNMTARHVIVAGKVTGDIHAFGKVSLTAKGRISGNVTTAAITIEEGGILQGNCKMEQAQVQEAGSPKKPAQASAS